MRAPDPRRGALAAALLLFPAALSEEALVFAPEQGAVVGKSFEVEGEVSLDDVQVRFNGESADPGMMGIEGDIDASFGYSLVTSDEYAAVADGRPLELLRTFEELELWYESSDGESDSGSGDEIVGKTVRFLWDEDEERYERSFVDDEGDEEDLEGLGEDLDLRALLPGREVSVGDVWEVPGEELLAVLLPGVAAGELLADADVSADVAEAIEEALSEATATCTYAGEVERDGRTLALLEFSSSLEEALELDPELLGAEAEGMEMEFRLLDLSYEIEVEGECAWDLAAGRFHSLELSGSGEAVLEAEVELTPMELTIEGEAEFSVALEGSASASG